MNGSGPGKPNDDGSEGDGGGIPNYPKRESVKKTEERLHGMDEKLRRMKEVSDSDSDEEDECLRDIKAGFNELPDSEHFSYNLQQGSGLEKKAERVWNDPKAKKELLTLCNRLNNPNAKIQEKWIKGLKKVTELKNNPKGIRIFIYREKNKQPTVIAFCMRDDLKETIKKLKKNFS
jgi:hypothetical protein